MPPSLRRQLLGALLTTLIACGVAPVAHAEGPANDPFYAWSDPAALAAMPPGTVLRTRSRLARVFGATVPMRVVQVLYRSEDIRHRPVVNVTSVVRPAARPSGRVLSYQSFYDSRDPADEPSYALWGGTTLGGLIPGLEHTFLLPLLLRGDVLVIPDTEGQDVHFLAGPEYGMHTLNSLRAVGQAPQTGIAPTARVALLGYSGGSIATEWAAELAPTYAPDVNARIIGATAGGLLVDLARSLDYMNGSAIWAGGIPLAIAGVEASFGVDFSPYLNAYGRNLVRALRHVSVIQALGRFPGLTWEAMANPAYANVRSVPVFVDSVNQLIMGTGGTPTVPLYVVQASRGALEGTRGDRPGIGPGDGIMRLGDVHALLRQYCDAGVRLRYDEVPGSSHLGAIFVWLPKAIGWIDARYAGAPAPDTCARVPHVPRLQPEVLVPPQG